MTFYSISDIYISFCSKFRIKGGSRPLALSKLSLGKGSPDVQKIICGGHRNRERRLAGQYRGRRGGDRDALRDSARCGCDVDARDFFLAGNPVALDLQVPPLGRAQGDTQRLKTHKGSARRK